jgi:hypothetical protein
MSHNKRDRSDLFAEDRDPEPQPKKTKIDPNPAAIPSTCKNPPVWAYSYPLLEEPNMLCSALSMARR